jgi:hypothetical protein
VAGRKKKRSKRKRSEQGTAPDDLTTEQYHRAWSLFAAGTLPKQIRRIVGLTASQLHRLYREGLPARGGRRKALPGFEQRLAEEQAAIRSEAVVAGKVVSTVGVVVLDKAMRNAATAHTLIDQIFRLIAENVEYVLTLPAGKRPPVWSVLPDEHTLKVLATMRAIGAGHKEAAATYRLIFDDAPAVHPATRATLNLAGAQAGRPGLAGAGRETLPAALAMLDDAMGDGTGAQLAEDLWGEMERWTPAQRAHYAQTGEEPKPVDVGIVIDVEASPVS